MWRESGKMPKSAEKMIATKFGLTGKGSKAMVAISLALNHSKASRNPRFCGG
jgi:hypothetical protein